MIRLQAWTEARLDCTALGARSAPAHCRPEPLGLYDVVGWRYRDLAGTKARIVLGASIPGDRWTAPIDKAPADRLASLAA